MRKVLLTLLSIFLLACSGSTGDAIATSNADPNTNQIEQCLPKIESQGDWLAGDGGRSVVLPNGKFVHLFGDTLIGPKEDLTFVGNTIGLAECHDGQYNIDFYWNDSHAFFEPEIEGVRLWPADGFYHNDKLYVLLSKITSVKTGLGFDYVGPIFAIVDNPLESPSNWNITFEELFNADSQYRPKSIVIDNGFVYMYASVVSEKGYPHPLTLMRAELDNIDSFDFDVNAYIVVEESSPNFYVHKYEDKWITFHARPEFGSREMVVQEADSLEGPWSEGELVYEFPEIDEGVFCYAVTEHPQWRLNDTAVVTYSCNTLSILPPLDKLDLYYPKAITIEL